jgi:WD40 repeat protein
MWNDLVLSGSSDLTVKVWDCNRQVCVQTLNGHEGIVHALAVIGDRLYSASSDCTIKVWNLQTNELINSVQASDNTVCTLATYCNQNQSILFSGSLKVVKV